MPSFDQAMFEIYRRAKDEAGYTASVFFQMLNDRGGGLETAKALINSPRPSDGYTRLFELQRLDLTVEALVIDTPEWQHLFHPDEIKRAQQRLHQYGYGCEQLG